MVQTLIPLLLLGVLFGGCSDSGRDPAPASPSASPPPPASPPVAPPPDDLAPLSDEFDDPARLGAWQRIFVVEQWGFDQLEQLDVGTTLPGWLTLVPYTSTWFEDYRGVLMFKEVQGDFVVTARVVSTNRAGAGAPGGQYSLAGIMVRAPRAVTPATWQPGGENYVFLSLGSADVPGQFQTEVKTTVSGNSNLEIDQAAGSGARIRVARIGEAVLALIREETTPWRVHRRYRRADFPTTLQVGLTVYTDWAAASQLTPQQQNTTLITNGQPDLRAQVDFVRYARPAVPAALAGRDLTNPAEVSDVELLTFLGQD